MVHAMNQVIRLKDARRGMVLLPFWGESTFKVKDDALDWGPVLHREWWQHIIIGMTDNEVVLARPYAYAREHFDSNSPLLGCEVYRVPKDSDHPYMIQRQDFTT